MYIIIRKPPAGGFPRPGGDDIRKLKKYKPTNYPVIYGADESDDWTDPKVWKKTNPSLDITVGIDKVKAACESAKQNPGEENAFRQLRLNQWVKQAVRWMPMERWDKCAFSVDEDELEGRVYYLYKFNKKITIYKTKFGTVYENGV